MGRVGSSAPAAGSSKADRRCCTPTMSSVTESPTRARRSRLRALLQDAGLDALLVTDLMNIRYLTGFTGSNAALLVSADDGTDEAGSAFCTDGRYMTQSADEVPDLPRRIDRPCDLALLRRRPPERSASRPRTSRCTAAGTSSRPPAIGSIWPRPSTWSRSCGRSRTPARSSRCGRACAVADRALAELIAAGGIRAGRTEREVGLDLDQRMRELGASDPSFETIVAAGANSAIPHHRPTAAAAGQRRPGQARLRRDRRRLPLRHDPHLRARATRRLAAGDLRAGGRRAAGRPGRGRGRRGDARHRRRVPRRDHRRRLRAATSRTGWATASAWRSTKRRAWRQPRPVSWLRTCASPSSRGLPAGAGRGAHRGQRRGPGRRRPGRTYEVLTLTSKELVEL